MRIWNAISMNLAILVACSGGNAATPGGNAATRNMRVVDPIFFDHHLEVRGTATSDPRMLHREGESVEDGDRIQALVTVTSREDVYLYLGYCDGHEFAMFPQQGGLRAEAGRETRIPPGDGGLKISGDSKSEVLYLILSKSELSLASPDLAVKIASSGGPLGGDCAGSGLSIPPQTAVDVRSSDGAIEVVRYEFKHEAPMVAP